MRLLSLTLFCLLALALFIGLRPSTPALPDLEPPQVPQPAAAGLQTARDADTTRPTSSVDSQRRQDLPKARSGLRGRLCSGEQGLAGVRIRLRRVPVRPEDPVLVEAETRPDGSFWLPHHRAERLRLDLSGPGIPAGNAHPLVSCEGEGVTELGVLQVARGRRLSGTLQVAGSRQPIAGAKIHWVCNGYSSPHFRFSDPGSMGAVLHTDGLGQFTLPALAPRQLHLFISKPGFASTLWTGEVTEQGTQLPLLTLKPGSRVTGIVVDDLGPIAGAVIRVLERPGPNPARQTRSGADGSFVLEGAGPKLHISHPGHRSVSAYRWARHSTPRRILMQRSTTLIGSIDAPPDRSTRLLVEVPGRRGWQLETNQEIGRDFRIEGLPAGKLRVRAWTRGYGMSQREELELSAGATQGLRLRVDPHPQLEILVRLAGRPLAGAELSSTLYPPTGFGAEIFRDPKARSDAAGRIKLALPLGFRGRLEFQHPRTVSQRIELGDWSPDQPLRVDLNPGLRIRGSIRGRKAQPRVWVQAHIRRQGGSQVQNLYFDGEDHFRSKALPPGAYEVGLLLRTPDVDSRARLDPRSLQRVTLQPGREAPPLRFELPRIGHVHGQVRAGPRVLPQARVLAWFPRNEDDRRRRETTYARSQALATDAQGSYRIPLTRRGTLCLQAFVPGSVVGGPIRTLHIRELGANHPLDLEIGTAEIRGRLDMRAFSAAEREAIAKDPQDQLQIQLYSVSAARQNPYWAPNHASALAWSRPRSRPDAQGHFHIRHVPAGEIVLRVVYGEAETRFQRLLQLQPGAIVELGKLGLPRIAELTLRCRPPREGRFGVQVYTADGDRIAAFMTRARITDNQLRLRRIPPGRYVFELHRLRGGDFPRLGYFWVSTGRRCILDLQADASARELIFPSAEHR